MAQVAYAYTLNDLITPAATELPGSVVLWSADGKKAVLATNPEGHSPLDLSFTIRDIEAGLDLGSLKLDPLVETEGDAEQFASALVVFSSSGNLVGWTQDAEFADQPSDAYVLNLETGNKQRVPSASSTFTGLSGFSPDERFLLSANANRVAVTEVESGLLIVLAKGAAPAWQPRLAQSAEVRAVEGELLIGPSGMRPSKLSQGS